MGAGVFGLSIAWVCVRRGARVRVIDPCGPGGGASGGIVGALAPHTPDQWIDKKAFQFESLIMAQSFWAQIDATSGMGSGYGRTGRLQPIADDRALRFARDRAVSAVDLWQGQAVWQIESAQDFGDWSPPSATGLLIRDSLSARIDPKRACMSLAAALATLGVGIQAEAKPEGKVIWATGYEGLLALSGELSKPVGNGVKGQAALLRYEASDAPQLFADGMHIVPHDNGTVAIGSTSERYFEEPSSTDQQLDDLIARAFVTFPVLKSADVIGRWAGVRPRAKSRAPMLGGYPGRPDQFIANGGFKIGFGMAPKLAHVMADLVLDGVDAIPADFRIEASL